MMNWLKNVLTLRSQKNTNKILDLCRFTEQNKKLFVTNFASKEKSSWQECLIS